MRIEEMNAEWMQFNAKLQKKKNELRKILSERGVLQKGGNNKYDGYKYFSEAQYKELFTELFSKCNLELKFTELAYETFEGTEKQANGRMPKLRFDLIDVETGFFESTEITGEGIDKGDKAGYKAYTGALKYYLANTFMVSTGDDPEKDSPDTKMNTKKKVEQPKQTEQPTKINQPKIKALISKCTNENVPLEAVLKIYKVDKVENITETQYANMIFNWEKVKEAVK